MKADEIENLETIKRLITNCFNTLKQTEDQNNIKSAEIRFYDYYELASVIRNLMKLCIVALDQDTAEVPATIKNQSIDIGLILGIALQLFPIDEFELLSEISYLYPDNQQKNEDNEKLKNESA